MQRNPERVNKNGFIFIKIAGDMGESFLSISGNLIYREVSTKNSNIKCEYAIISIMDTFISGQNKTQKLLSKKGGKPIASKTKETSNGIDNFEKLRLNDSYVDKTGLIKELLKTGEK